MVRSWSYLLRFSFSVLSIEGASILQSTPQWPEATSDTSTEVERRQSIILIVIILVLFFLGFWLLLLFLLVVSAVPLLLVVHGIWFLFLILAIMVV
jgi:hypothetical protein